VFLREKDGDMDAIPHKDLPRFLAIVFDQSA
jgi:hypothetical protein